MKHKIWRVARIIVLVVIIVLCMGYQPSSVWAAPPYFGFAIRAGSTGDDSAIAVAIDTSANVVVAGVFSGTVDFDPGAGVTNLTSAGGDDVFVAKYSVVGALIWARALSGTEDIIAGGIAVDGTDNVYTVGTLRGTVDFDPGPGTTNLTSSGGADVFVSKLDSNGDFVWARSMGGSEAGEYGRDITVDPAGNVHTTGYLYSSTADFDPGPGTYNLTNAGQCDMFVSKLDSDGNFAWAGSMGGTEYDFGYSIALDGQGNVHVASSFQDTADFDPGPGTSTLTAQWYDIAVIKLDSNGNLVWAGRMGGSDQDEGLSIIVDAQGNVYTTGIFYSDTADFDPGSGVYYLTSQLYDVFISKLDSNGDFVWARALSGSASEYGWGISVDELGYVYTTGSFEDTVDFDPGSGTSNLTGAGMRDVFISKLDSDGNFVWAGALRGTGDNYGNDVLVDSSGTIYTTGVFQGTADFDPDTGTVNRTAGGGTDMFVSALTQPAVDLSTSAADFGDQIVGTTSTAQSVALNNSGGAPLTIGSIAATGDYAQTNDCPISPSTLAAGASCTIEVIFSPSAAGTRAGDLTVTSNAASSPDAVTLTGNGIAPGVDLSPSSLAFCDQRVGTTSAARPITLENTGSAALTISSIAASGNFGQSNDCPASPATLAVGGRCTIDVTFSPTALGTRAGDLTVTSNAPSSPDVASLTGTGTEPPAGDGYEDDDACARASVIVTDGTVQVHDLHQVADADWVQFVAASGTTYLIETVDPGPDADNTLELFNRCDGPPQDFDDNAFGPTSRMAFNCTDAGSYYVRVAHHDPAVYGAGTAYSLRVRIDTTPPAPPRDVAAMPGDASVVLQWCPNDELDVVGYRLRYGTSPGSHPYTVNIDGSRTAAYILGGLGNGTTYYMTLSAVDFGGNESDSSDQVSAVPNPGADFTAPTVSIQQPVSTAFYKTVQASVLISGTCSDDEGHLNYAHVVNAANGEQRWDYAPQGDSDTFMVGGLPLEMGDNAVVVTVYDTASNYATDLVTIRRVEGEGVAIIVAGHNEINGSQLNIYNVTNRAYWLFRQAGFRRDHITYLSPEPQDADLPKDGVSDVTGDSTPANLEAAITTWAVDKVGPGIPVFIYLIDHGVQDYFCANGCGEPGEPWAGRVWANQLDSWLGALESDTGADMVNVILEACFSGSFIEQANEISAPGRVVIASTAQNLQAYASANGACFSDAFLTALEGGDALDSAYAQSWASVNDSIGVFQEPWLDDNGNAMHNDAGDGSLAATRTLLAAMVGQQPTIVEAEATLGDVSATDMGARKIDLAARVKKGDGWVQAIWAAIYVPSWTPPHVDPGETAEDGADLVRLTDPDGDGLYTGTYVLGEQGTYRVVFQGVDDDGSQAMSRRITVHSSISVYLPFVIRGDPIMP